MVNIKTTFGMFLITKSFNQSIKFYFSLFYLVFFTFVAQ